MTALPGAAPNPDELMNRFSEEQGKLAAAWANEQRAIPRRLFHYTTLDGMRGILESNSLWMSDARYMNDASEMSYAVSLIGSVVDSVISQPQNAEIASAIPRGDSIANAFDYGTQPYIACFCEAGDLLSQWRGYGRTDDSVSLGLDLSPIEAFNLPAGVILRRVLYDVHRQKGLATATVEQWIETIKNLRKGGVELNELFPYPAIWALQDALAEYYLCFKHPTFSEEREWRLVGLINGRAEVSLSADKRREGEWRQRAQKLRDEGIEWPDPPELTAEGMHGNAQGLHIEFRRSNYGFTPYLAMDLRDTAGLFTGRLPVWEVIQGPRAFSELALESLKMFLESKGFGFRTELRQSGVPLRS